MHDSAKPPPALCGEVSANQRPPARSAPPLVPLVIGGGSGMSPLSRPSADGLRRSGGRPTFSVGRRLTSGPPSVRRCRPSANGVSSTGVDLSDESGGRAGVSRSADSSVARSPVTIPRSWRGPDGGGRVGLHDNGGHFGTAGSYGAVDDTADHRDVPVARVGGSRSFEEQPGVPLPVRPRPLVGLPAARILAYYRRRSCPRAYLVTSPRFEGDTLWPLSQIAAYDLERRVGDLATQYISWDSPKHD